MTLQVTKMSRSHECNLSQGDDLLFSRPRRSRLLWPETKTPSLVRLFDIPIDNETLEASARRLSDAARQKLSTTVMFINAHAANHIEADNSYARCIARADIRYADGSGMAIAARLTGQPLIDNVNGTDLLPLLCAQASEHGLSLFLLGAGPGIAEKAAENLRQKYPKLIIAGTQHGFFKRGHQEERDVIDRINASGADILLVGFGVPSQDTWLCRHQDVLRVPVRMGVGGLFDFFSGKVSRAPFLFRKIGMEWIWRLMQEPKRMWRRYLVGNGMFFVHLLKRAFAGHGCHNPEPLTRMSALTRQVPTRHWDLALRDFCKRGLDLSLAGFGILATSPFLAAIALAIRLESRGPVLFRQQRVGINGKPFEMLKFRSMYTGADQQHLALQGEVKSAHDVRFKHKQDPRVTRVGRLIRRTSLDELPQLFNVLRGDMSIVGPRPALPSEVAHYSIGDRDRLLVKPGITCIWQVSGRADIDFVGQVDLDRRYIRHRSFLLDLWLMILTLPAVLSGRGAY